VIAELRTVMLLCGARTIAELQAAPKIIRGELRDWLQL
jgi:isopentenyl diphosphate isomerase/L-lactate dehydrogenase-like FMN-dependent dehydrogenase